MQAVRGLERLTGERASVLLHQVRSVSLVSRSARPIIPNVSSRKFSSTIRTLQSSSAPKPFTLRDPANNQDIDESSSTGLILSIKATRISRDQLVRLHRLSALNPPEEGSAEEAQLLEGLGELVGLMELVKEVELEGDVGELLAEGVGEVFIDAKSVKRDSVTLSSLPGEVLAAKGTQTGTDEKTGKELLNWATRRVGDFYAHRAVPKPGS